MNLIQQIALGGGAAMLLYFFWPKIKERLLANNSAIAVGSRLPSIPAQILSTFDEQEAPPAEVETFEHLVLVRQRLKSEKRRTDGIDTAIRQLAEDITQDESKK